LLEEHWKQIPYNKYSSLKRFQQCAHTSIIKMDLFLVTTRMLGRRLSQNDGSVFLEYTARSKTRDGVHKLYAGEGHEETKRGE